MHPYRYMYILLRPIHKTPPISHLLQGLALKNLKKHMLSFPPPLHRHLCMSKENQFFCAVMTPSEPRHDKTNNVAVRPGKTQISLGIRSVWLESSMSAWRKLGSLAIHWAHSEDSDQNGWMPRLIWVFAGRTLILLVLSCRGSACLVFCLIQSWLSKHVSIIQILSIQNKFRSRSTCCVLHH